MQRWALWEPVDGDRLPHKCCSLKKVNGGEGLPENRPQVRTTARNGSPETLHNFAVALNLVEAGKVNLDAPVVRYLPYFHRADNRYQIITDVTGMANFVRKRGMAV